MTADFHAIVPQKALRSGKTRLRRAFSPAERHALCRAMLIDTMTVLAGAPAVASASVVTDCSEAAKLARSFGFAVIADRAVAGPTEAVALAMGMAPRERGLLIVMGDLPLMTIVDIGRVAAATAGPRAVTLVPDLSGRGTNAVGLARPDLMRPLFDGRGIATNLERARAGGAEPAVLDLPRLRIDLDRPEDARRIAARPGDSIACSLLTRWAAGRRGPAAASPSAARCASVPPHRPRPGQGSRRA